jgi:hypothetical protein
MRPEVTKITDHVAQALKRLLYQYRALPASYEVPLAVTGGTVNASALGAVLAVIVDQIQDIENGLFSVDEGRMYFDGVTFPAEGAQLDGLGDLLGIERNGLTDEVYRLFITAKIAEDNSSGTVEELLFLVRLLFQSPLIQMFEAFPAEVRFHLTSAILDPTLYIAAQEMIRRSMPAGVLLGGITVTSATSVFMFSDKDGPSVGGGFGDANNTAPLYQESGGWFASLI